MNIASILFFFLSSWGAGASITYFVKKPEKLSELIIMQIAIGLGTLPILFVIMDLLHIPLDYRIILILCLALPIYSIYKKRQDITFPTIKVTKSTIYLGIALVLFALTFYMYHHGSFNYPWLEDGDPWDYAVAAKYIATYKTYDPPQALQSLYRTELVTNQVRYISNYLPPYPPGYVVLMGVLNETNSSVNWTLKFFTCLIASLGILFFYFFAKEFTKDYNVAIFATLVVAVVPGYLSHFTYSLSLAVTLIIPALYCLEKTRTDSKWWIVAGVCISGILVTQSSTAAVFALLFMPGYFAVRFFTKDQWKSVLYAGILGLMLSLIFWGSMTLKYTWAGTNPTRAGSLLDARRGAPGDFYTLSDFVWAVAPSTSNMIDNPKGLGPAVFLVGLIGLAYFGVQYKRIKPWLAISVIWVFFNALNVNAERLPIGFSPHRGWSTLTLSVAFVAAYGIVELANTLKKHNIEKPLFFGILIITLFLTSGWHKYDVNTSMWPTHYFGSESDIAGYMWLKNLPDNTPATSICRDDTKVIGMDKFSTKQWDPAQQEYVKKSLNDTVDGMYSFYKTFGYQYVVLDSSCLDAFGINKTNQRLQEMVSSTRFRLVYPTTQAEQGTAFVFGLA